MFLYHISFLVKIIIGSLILYFLYTKINVYKEPTFAVPIAVLGIFFLIWGISFFIFYITKKIIGKKSNYIIASNSFKLSLFFSLYLIINIILIVLENWNKYVGIGILVIFIILQMLIIKDE